MHLPSSVVRRPSSRVTADLALIVVTAVWGATFFMIKDALAGVSPFWFMALRFSLAALLLAPFVLLGSRADISRSMVAGALVGLLLFLGYALQTLGLQYTSASRAGFITGLTVVFVPLAQAVRDRALPAVAVITGVALSLAGMALLSFGSTPPEGFVQGDLLVLGCALGFTGHILALGWAAPRHAVLPLTLGQVSLAGALSLAAAITLETFNADGLVQALPAVVFTAAFATVAAYYIQARAQRFTSATHTALIFALEPVFAALFASILAGERLTPTESLGCALILVGMLAAQLSRTPRYSGRPKTASS